MLDLNRLDERTAKPIRPIMGNEREVDAHMNVDQERRARGEAAEAAAAAAAPVQEKAWAKN